MINAKGCREDRAYSLGKKLTLKQAVLAKCADCMGKYADGKLDCEIPECSLYPFMPYGAMWRARERRTMPESQKRLVLKNLKRVSTRQDGGAK